MPVANKNFSGSDGALISWDNSVVLMLVLYAIAHVMMTHSVVDTFTPLRQSRLPYGRAGGGIVFVYPVRAVSRIGRGDGGVPARHR